METNIDIIHLHWVIAAKATKGFKFCTNPKEPWTVYEGNKTITHPCIRLDG